MNGVLFFSHFHEPAFVTKIQVIVYKINDFLDRLVII